MRNDSECWKETPLYVNNQKLAWNVGTTHSPFQELPVNAKSDALQAGWLKVWIWSYARPSLRIWLSTYTQMLQSYTSTPHDKQKFSPV